MNRRLFIGTFIGATAVVAATGAVIAIAETPGPVFIAGDKPVTEEQVRTKLQTDGYADIQVVRQGQYFMASGARDGKPAKLRVDSRTGRLADDDDDDDD